MFKTLLARNATRKANTTKRILSDDYMPSCMKDCDELWETESMDSSQFIQKGKTYCFSLEQTYDTITGRRAGTGFAILDGDNIDLETYDYTCGDKQTAKNIYAATTPNSYGRLYKLKPNKDRTARFIDIPATSYSATFTYNGRQYVDKAKIYLSLDTDTPHTIESTMTFYTNGDQYYDCEYIYVADPDRFDVSVENGLRSTAMFSSSSIDGINTHGQVIQGTFSAEAGIIQAIPSEMVKTTTVMAATYTAKSSITIKRDSAGLPDKYIELTPDTIYTFDKSKTGLIVGVVVGVVVVIAIVVFCVYWFKCRAKSDDKEEEKPEV